MSRSVFCGRRDPASQPGVRRRARQPAVGHDSATGRRRRDREPRRLRPVYPRRRHLHGAIRRPCQSLPAVSRARDRARSCRRTHGPGAAGRDCDGSVAARDCGDFCSRAAMSTRSSVSTISAASFRFTAASASSLLTATPGRRRLTHRVPDRRQRSRRSRFGRRRTSGALPWFNVQLPARSSGGSRATISRFRAPRCRWISPIAERAAALFPRRSASERGWGAGSAGS